LVGTEVGAEPDVECSLDSRFASRAGCLSLDPPAKCFPGDPYNTADPEHRNLAGSHELIGTGDTAA
jgi:hypothetical protein